MIRNIIQTFARKSPICNSVGAAFVAGLMAVGSDIAIVSPAAGAGMPQIWFAPLDPIYRPRVRGGGSSDFGELFGQNAAWQRAASTVRVFKLYPQFVSKTSDDELRRVLVGLRERHFALAIEFPLLVRKSDCGRTEGYGDRANQTKVADRIRWLGGDLQFVAADEPLYFGHSFQGKEGCRLPLGELAQEAAGTARAFRLVFPNVRFVDIEPISNFKEHDWVDLVAQWHSAFRQAFGEPFAAFHLDINWARPWQDRARAIVERVRGEGMRIGVIYNGNPQERPDPAWLEDARRHYEAYEALEGPPDDAIFQSWVQRPTHVLPESAPDAFTHLILEYAASHPGVAAGRR